MIVSGKISLGLISKAIKNVNASNTTANTYKSCFTLESGYRQVMVFKKESGVWHFDTDDTLKETRKLNKKNE